MIDLLLVVSEEGVDGKGHRNEKSLILGTSCVMFVVTRRVSSSGVVTLMVTLIQCHLKMSRKNVQLKIHLS